MSMKPKRKKKRRPAKRKVELVAPQCRADCPIAHTIEDTAALLSCSPATVENMMDAGLLPYIEVGVGLERKSRRVPHDAIYELRTRVA
jgi:hypothetical protein